MSGSVFLVIAIRDAVAVHIAGIIAAGENIIYYPDRVRDVNIAVTVGVSRFERIGCRTPHKNVIYNKDRVRDINYIIAVGVAAKIAGIPGAIAVGILLPRIGDIRAVIGQTGVGRVSRISVSVSIRISAGVANIAVTVTIGILLTRISGSRTIIASIADSIRIAVVLTGIIVIRTIVIPGAVTVIIDIIQRIIRADIAGIADTVIIGILLQRIGH